MIFRQLFRRSKRFFTKWFRELAIGLIVFCELALILLLHFGALKLSPNVSYQAFTIVPLFFLAVAQLVYNGNLQKSEFIRNYAENYFTNEALYTTFHELVYKYSDKDFESIEAVITQVEASGDLLEGHAKPVFFYYGEAARRKPEGCRFYHPDYFQGSPEERRLDMLIGYFNLLGYHYRQGYFSIEEVAGSLGHCLNILSKRKVIKKVRKVYQEAVHQPTYAENNGRIEPFCYFEELMLAIETLNLELEQKKADLDKKRATILKVN